MADKQTSLHDRAIETDRAQRVEHSGQRRSAVRVSIHHCKPAVEGYRRRAVQSQEQIAFPIRHEMSPFACGIRACLGAISARSVKSPAAEQAPLNSVARAGGRRLSTLRSRCDRHTV